MKLRKRFGVVLVLAMLVSVLAMTMTASAAKKTKISQKSATIAAGKSVKLSVKNAKGKKVKWSSEDEDIAKVTSNGKVTGVNGGVATIKAKVGGKTYSCAVTVEAVQFKNLTTELEPTVSLTADIGAPQSAYVDEYYYTNSKVSTDAKNKLAGVNKRDLKPYLNTYPAGLAVKWSSSNTAIVKVEDGVITAVANGDAVITAEASDGSGAADTVVVTVRGIGDDSTGPVVITMANKDRLFDKYIGKVKVSTFFVDKDGNLLKPGTAYATVDTSNKNAESWKDEDGDPNQAQYTDKYYYYVKDEKVNPVNSYGTATVRFNVTVNKANFDGKKFGIEKASKPDVNPSVSSSTLNFGQIAFPKDTDEIIVYIGKDKDNKDKAYNGWKKTVYSVSGVAGKTLLASQYGYDESVYLNKYADGNKYPNWRFDTYSDETITSMQVVLYNK